MGIESLTDPSVSVDRFKFLEHVLDQLLEHSSVSRDDWCEAINCVYYISSQHSAYTNDSLADFITWLGQIVERYLKKLIREISSASNLIDSYLKAWNAYTKKAKTIDAMCASINHCIGKQQQVYAVANGNFSVQSSAYRSAEELLLSFWYDIIVTEFGQMVIDEYITDISNQIHSGCVKDLSVETSLTASLGNPRRDTDYWGALNEDPVKDIFGEKYLELVAQFADSRHMRLHTLGSSDEEIRDYLCRTGKFLSLECSRARIMLNEAMYERFLASLQDRLVKRHSKLIKDWCARQAQLGQYELLGQLYKELLPLQAAVEIFVEEVVISMRQQSDRILRERPANVLSNPEAFVTYFHESYTLLLQLNVVQFQEESRINDAIDAGFVAIVNVKPPPREFSAEKLLARFSDNLLKKAVRGKDSKLTLPDAFSQMTDLLRFVTNKPLFVRLYAKFLCKRLLFSTPEFALEEAAFRALCDTCTCEHTTSLWLMMSDRKNERHVVPGPDDRCEYSVSYLRKLVWPSDTHVITEDQFVSRVPTNLLTTTMHIHHFFKKMRSHQRETSELNRQPPETLELAPGLTTLEIQLNYTSKNLSIQLTLLPAATLLAFMDSTSLSIEELHGITAIPTSELRRIVSALSQQNLLTVDSTVPEDITLACLNLSYSKIVSRLKLLNLTYNGRPVGISPGACDIARSPELVKTVVSLLRVECRASTNGLTLDKIQAQLASRGTIVSDEILRDCLEKLMHTRLVVETDRNYFVLVEEEVTESPRSDSGVLECSSGDTTMDID